MWDFNCYKNKIALIDDVGTSVTYGEMTDFQKKICNVIEKRSLVFMLCSNTIGSVIGYASFLNGGIVPALFHASIEKDMLQQLINIYRPSFLWIPHQLENKFPYVHIVYKGYGYSLVKTSFEKSGELHEDLALLLTTSGSTGSSKLVRQSYANILFNAQSIVQYLELTEEERPISTLPMNYTYGLSVINSHLLAGSTLLFTDKSLMNKEFWDFMKNQRATSFPGVTYTYEMLERLRFTQMNLPHLRYMTQAGGRLPDELHRKYAEYAFRTGKKFIIMYGQCEATTTMSYLPAEKSLDKCGSIGIAIPGGALQLVDEKGNIIAEADKAGEVVYKGANVTYGYAQTCEDLLKGDEWNGVLYTGDIAKRDRDGFYYIVGRKKRFLKVYGNRVNMDEIESMIKNGFPDLDCAVGGTDDHMCIFLTREERLKEVIKFIAEKTGLNKQAFYGTVIDEVPRNDSGKILYKELEKYA